MDLSTLSVAQLHDLHEQIPAELKRRESQKKDEVLNEMRALAEAHGYVMEDFLGKEVKVKVVSGKKVKVKYRHPENQKLEWTGRGRKPKWVEAWLASNGDINNLLV